MAYNSILGRLAQAREAVKTEVPTADHIDKNNETPERNLWIAVIERALKDYCFFFDRLVTTGNGQLIVYTNLDEVKRQNFNLQAIAELNRLRGWIFTRKPEPYNLQWLSDQLFDTSDSAADAIRREALKQFKLHFLQVEERNEFGFITHYIRNNVNIDGMPTAVQQSSLRFKRYRLLT